MIPKRLSILVIPVALSAMAQDSAVPLEHGQWEYITRMTSIELPGLSQEEAAEVRAGIRNGDEVRSRCISPEDAANPAASLANPGGRAQGCTFSRQVFAGGAIDVAGACPGPAPGSTIGLTLAGSHTATQIDAIIGADFDGGAQSMRLRGTMTGRRLGPCEAD